jgi:uncharacterized protein YcbX
MTLTEINIYPIKSCRGFSATTWELEPRGLRFDRRWMLVDDNGIFMTQRLFPRMTLISVQVKSDHLQVEAPNMSILRVPFRLRSNHFPVVVWDDVVEAAAVGKESDEWFSEFLGVSCKLAAMTESSLRLVDARFAFNNEAVSFADGFPMLLISEASLADLNGRLEKPIPMSRFRPNLVVRGCDAFAEDTWKEIVIGGMELRIVKPCARCTITTVDTETGEKSHEPLRTLAAYRQVENRVLFGQNVIPTVTGTMRVGDEVRVIR